MSGALLCLVLPKALWRLCGVYTSLIPSAHGAETLAFLDDLLKPAWQDVERAFAHTCRFQTNLEIASWQKNRFPQLETAEALTAARWALVCDVLSRDDPATTQQLLTENWILSTHHRVRIGRSPHRTCLKWCARRKLQRAAQVLCQHMRHKDCLCDHRMAGRWNRCKLRMRDNTWALVGGRDWCWF